MQWQVQGLVLAEDRAPEVEDFVHRVLLLPCLADGFSEGQRVVLEQFLAIVGLNEEARHIRTAPNNKWLFDLEVDILSFLGLHCHVLV